MAEELTPLQLIQRYRRDRRELLEFVLSSSLLKKVLLPTGAVSLDDVDLNEISVDHVISCARNGNPLDISEATQAFQFDVRMPPMASTEDSDYFYLVTNPSESGPAPTRKIPPIPSNLPASSSIEWKSLPEPRTEETSSESLDQFVQTEIPVSPGDSLEHGEGLDLDDLEEQQMMKDTIIPISRADSLQTSNDFSLVLPPLRTGLTEGDLRDTAYEVLLTSVGAAGGLNSPAKDRLNKDAKNGPKAGLSAKAKISPRASGLAALVEVMRVQLKVPEDIDSMTREALLQVGTQRRGRRLDSLLIPLELLCLVPRYDLKDKQTYASWSRRQLQVLEEGLINCSTLKGDGLKRYVPDFKALSWKFLEAEESPEPTCSADQSDALRDLREIAFSLAGRNPRGAQGTTEVLSHWADGYHFNVCIYKELLRACFDADGPGQLLPEFNEVQEMLKSTWRILGITQTIHDILFMWAQFNQFVETGSSEESLFTNAVAQLKKLPADSKRSPRERALLSGLVATLESEDGEKDVTFSLLQSVLTPIKRWLDSRLKDYHANFKDVAQGSESKLEEYLSAAVITARLLAEEEQKHRSAEQDISMVHALCESYITASIDSEFTRLLERVSLRPESQSVHYLSLLASDIRSLLETESSVYSPVFLQYNPLSLGVAVSLLHELYGQQLNPFLDTVTVLTEEVKQVLPAAANLEVFFDEFMAKLPNNGDDAVEALIQVMEPFEVSSISATLAMRWVNSQLASVNEWIERSLQSEKWEPVSKANRHGVSVVDVFHIIEESLDEFFGFSLPVKSNVVRSLTTGIDSSLQRYINRVIKGLGSKEDLLPLAPSLTRFKKDIAEKQQQQSSKRVVDVKLSDSARAAEIDLLSISSLCVRLNSLHFIGSQMDSLESEIKSRWSKQKFPEVYCRLDRGKRASDPSRRAVKGDDLVAMFDPARRVVNIAIDRICDFLGTKVVFWDLRGPFLDDLYKVSVKEARVDVVIDLLDPVLGELCEVISDHLRDRAVLALLQAALDGYLRVLLDGGPTRVFQQSDSEYLEIDISMLKDFFVAEGDGLPRKVVENAAAPVQQILNLYQLETNIVIENFRQASEAMAASGSSSFNISKGRSAMDADTLLRVLCHRGDKEASKFLKKNYKLPKTL